MKPSITSRKNAIYRTLAVLFCLGVWQAASMSIGQEILLVSPVRAAGALIRMMGTRSFYQSVLSSFGRILAGFALGTVSGVLLAAAAGCSRLVRTLLEPLMHAVKATPVASFVILALIFIRSAWLSVFTSFLMVLPIMYTSVLAGIDSADEQLLEMARVFRMSWPARVRGIYLNAAYPHFLSACVLAMGMCWKAGIAAEVIGLPAQSIGAALYQAKIFFSTPDMYAWTLAIVLLSLLFEKVMLRLTALIGRRMGGM